MNNISVKIKGCGAYLPEKVLTNDDLTKIVDTSDEWIYSRSGIKERRIAAKEESTSDLAYKASLNAIKNSGVDLSDIDALIVATITPDKLFPSTSAILQAKLGLRNVMSFDINAACTGFIYSIELASSLIKTGKYKNILIVGAEKLSSIVNWNDRATCVLFGDGAGAAVLSATEDSSSGILNTRLYANGENSEILHMPAGGSALPASEDTVKNELHYLQMNGKEVFKFAVRAMEQAIVDSLKEAGISKEQVSLIVPHQANVRIIETIAQRLNLGMDLFHLNLSKVGNTSAASIPLALSEACDKNKIKAGDYVVLVAFGAGLTWGASVIKWN